jgi:citrate lyase subunit beta / citryl-CoA lyase
VLKVEDIVRCDGVEAVSYGPADLAYSVGGRTEAYSQNLFIKTLLVVAASAYGVDAVDGVFFELQDLDGFRKEAMQSRDLGYVGKQVVHPSQISVANEVYSPNQEEIASANMVYVFSATLAFG